MAATPEGLARALWRESLIDSLAAIEHDRWSHWQEYLHAQCRPNDDGSLTIPADLVARWTKQMSTPYARLSPAEKESDREQVRRYIPVIESALTET
ncbi:hypothetical protein Mycsm_06583 (plasmid) [Mycobacterium sp. JS623]|uniref:hypothetical protein n=1 Tax=Mycobacterium sp. JS623 TaxID=212767 RepID=UPI0002A55A74|nr:hypothetical protein [Mycobacterium sp. JS623]AGB26719.1 hypothetical protein Mycsm_06583 [Mycobacterium sp. JS623]